MDRGPRRPRVTGTAGLINRSLRPLIAGLIPGYSSGQMPHDLRRLRRKGLIHRIPRASAAS